MFYIQSSIVIPSDLFILLSPSSTLIIEHAIFMVMGIKLCWEFIIQEV